MTLGPTGEYPYGKLTEDDHGALSYAVGRRGDTVIVDFGPTPVAWIGMGAQDAVDFAQALIRQARATGESLKFNCEICHGEKGGVRGNIIDGKIVCDYCHAEMG